MSPPEAGDRSIVLCYAFATETIIFHQGKGMSLFYFLCKEHNIIIFSLTTSAVSATVHNPVYLFLFINSYAKSYLGRATPITVTLRSNC